MTFDNKCFGVTNGKAYNDPVKSRGQCIFPFKHQNVEYMNCTMADHDGLWCATSVDKNLNWQTRGFCTKACPFEGTFYFTSNIFLNTHVKNTNSKTDVLLSKQMFYLSASCH